MLNKKHRHTILTILGQKTLDLKSKEQDATDLTDSTKNFNAKQVAFGAETNAAVLREIELENAVEVSKITDASASV